MNLPLAFAAERLHLLADITQPDISQGGKRFFVLDDRVLLRFVAYRTKDEGHQPLDPAKGIVRRPWPPCLNQVIAVITTILKGFHLPDDTQK